MPRSFGNTFLRGIAARLALRAENAAKVSRFYSGCHSDAGSWNRHEHGDIQLRGCLVDQATALSAGRKADGFSVARQEERLDEQQRHVHGRLSGLSASQYFF